MQKRILIVAIILIQFIFIHISLKASTYIIDGTNNPKEITIEINAEKQEVLVYSGKILLMSYTYEKGDSTFTNFLKEEVIIDNKVNRTITERELSKLFPGLELNTQKQTNNSYHDSSQTIIDYFYKAVKSLTSNPF